MVLTVISASYNAVKAIGASAVERCVKSIEALPFEHEHLIMDGGSTDGTLELLASLSAKGLRVYSEKDNGIYDALNKGLAKASGDYVYILGLDDFVFDAEAMRVAYETAVRTDCDIIISPIKYSDGKIRPRRKSAIYEIFYRMSYPHQGILVKTSRLRAIGGFDADYKISADYMSCLRLHLEGVKVQFCGKPYAEFALSGLSCEDRGSAVAERSEFLSKVYGGDPERVSGGVIPWRHVARFLFSRCAFTRRMGVCALMKRIFATAHTKDVRVYYLFGMPVFRRRRRSATHG